MCQIYKFDSSFRGKSWYRKYNDIELLHFAFDFDNFFWQHLTVSCNNCCQNYHLRKKRELVRNSLFHCQIFIKITYQRQKFSSNFPTWHPSRSHLTKPDNARFRATLRINTDNTEGNDIRFHCSRNRRQKILTRKLFQVKLDRRFESLEIFKPALGWVMDSANMRKK